MPNPLVQRAEDAVRAMAAGRFAQVESQYDAAMAAALPPGKLVSIWTDLQSQVGPFQSITASNVVASGRYHTAVISCKFAAGDFQALVAFDAGGKISGLFFRPAPLEAPAWAPPPYAQPADFHESAITVSDGAWDLPGTLTVPDGKGPFPAVVLIPGSGAADQDESIGPNQPFKDLAWGLASRGIAVLRFEKRTKKYGARSSPDGAPLTVKQEYLDDAAAAIALAARTPQVDLHHVYVLGHSQGGTIAPRIAAANPQVAGIILLAGATTPMPDAIVEQMKYLATLPPEMGGVTGAQVQAAEAAAQQLDSPNLKPDAQVDLLGTTVDGAYFLGLRNYHPAQMAALLHIPMLILQGGRDYQVTKTDYDTWQKALASHRNASFRWFPDLDHLFMTAPGSGLTTPHDYSIPGHVDPDVIAAIASWIGAQSTRSAGAGRKGSPR